MLRLVSASLLAVLGYIAVGGIMSAAAGTAQMRGQMVDIGQGRQLHMICEGAPSQAPTVLLEAGAFGFSADWGAVQQALLAKGIRSCAYDRAGLGASQAAAGPRDGLAISQDLEALLRASKETGPFILVGHSMAGAYVTLFALRNPDKVAGLVLVDAAPPIANTLKPVSGFVTAFARASRAAAFGASIGLFKPLVWTGLADKIGLPPAASAEKRRAFASGAHNRAAANEVAQWPMAAEQARSLGRLDPALPVAVVTAGPATGMRKDWKQVQATPALESRSGFVHHIAEASHNTLLGQTHCIHIIQAIGEVAAAVHRP
jgi:pimeloyl-ACP methyl ester carboxylesterase